MLHHQLPKQLHNTVNFCSARAAASPPQERQPLFFNIFFSIHNRQQINCLNQNWQAWRFVSVDRVSIARLKPDWNELYAYKILRWGAWNDSRDGKNLTKEFMRKMGGFRKKKTHLDWRISGSVKVHNVNFWLIKTEQVKQATKLELTTSYILWKLLTIANLLISQYM